MDERARFAAAVERIVLIGFMGSGKSSVGRLLADRLGWTLIDTDAMVEARLGVRVSEVFDRFGEAAFRDAEHDVTVGALAGSRVVVSTGGGWPEREGSLETVPPGSLVVWLDAALDELLRRTAAQPGVRPLLEGSDRAERARSLLERREPRYARAQLHLSTTGKDPAAIAEEIVRWARDEESTEKSESN